jgi:hypothetical protein
VVVLDTKNLAIDIFHLHTRVPSTMNLIIPSLPNIIDTSGPTVTELRLFDKGQN